MELKNSMGTVFFLDNLVPVTVDQVRTGLESSELDPDMARDLAKRFCFVRAKNRLRADGLIDEVMETPERWTWQLSRRYREANHLGYEFEASFWFDKTTQTVGADNPPLLARVQALFALYGGLYLCSDITCLVRRIFDAQKGMVRLRHCGAVYFVPQENAGLLDKVKVFLKAIGGECITVSVGIENEAVREKALQMLVESVRNESNKIADELKAIQAEGSELTKRKAKHRWRELYAQLDRIKVFARSLSADAQDLIGKVRTRELDLALAGKADLDVIASLAHAGRLNGALGQIAVTLCDGELPSLTSPRVRAAELLLDGPEHLDLPAVASRSGVGIAV